MAFIRFSIPYKGHMAMTVPPAKAREIQDFLDNPPDDLTMDQSDFLLAIHRIYHGKATQATAAPQETPDDPDRLHEGIYQSMDSAVPNGDR